MNKFWVLVTGAGEGCDHTIGCNMNWMRLEGCVDMAGAQEMIKTMLNPTGNDDEQDFLCGIDQVQSILILEVDKTQPVNVSDLKSHYRTIAHEAEKSEKEKEELAELQRLKQKYPDD